MSSIVVYAFICIHPDCKDYKVKYVGSTTQQLTARMGTHKSAGNELVQAHDKLHKGKTKLAILEAWTNGRNLRTFLLVIGPDLSSAWNHKERVGCKRLNPMDLDAG